MFLSNIEQNTWNLRCQTHASAAGASLADVTVFIKKIFFQLTSQKHDGKQVFHDSFEVSSMWSSLLWLMAFASSEVADRETLSFFKFLIIFILFVKHTCVFSLRFHAYGLFIAICFAFQVNQLRLLNHTVRSSYKSPSLSTDPTMDGLWH